MVSRKRRRHSGRVTPRSDVPKKLLKKHNLFIDPFYNEWANYRDGFRDWIRDFKLIKDIKLKRSTYFNEDLVRKRILMNKKQQRLLIRRKKIKGKELLKKRFS